MSRLAVFGLGILCGIVIQTMLIFLYSCIRINHKFDIEKK